MLDKQGGTMSYIYWEKSFRDIAEKRPKSPLMIIALEGLFDIAEGATTALRHLIKHTDADEIATISSEEFFDFSRERPVMRLESGGRRIAWPDTTFYLASAGGSSDEATGVGSDAAAGGDSSSADDSTSSQNGSAPDLLLVVGVEPHLRWKTFAGCLLDIATELGVSMVVTMGSPPGHAPHTRPLGVVGSTTNNELAARLGLGSPTYEGPTGLIGVLHEKLDKLGIPSFSLKVSVPHYVTSPPNPEASRSLLARLELITGVDTGHSEFDEAAVEWRERIDSAVAADEEIAHYVRTLEQEVDSNEGMLPSGSELAQQLEAFLRGGWGADN